eukprot:6960115-Pyramimonas_sp.AAC.1
MCIRDSVARPRPSLAGRKCKGRQAARQMPRSHRASLVRTAGLGSCMSRGTAGRWKIKQWRSVLACL